MGVVDSRQSHHARSVRRGLLQPQPSSDARGGFGARGFTPHTARCRRSGRGAGRVHAAQLPASRPHRHRSGPWRGDHSQPTTVGGDTLGTTRGKRGGRCRRTRRSLHYGHSERAGPASTLKSPRSLRVIDEIPSPPSPHTRSPIPKCTRGTCVNRFRDEGGSGHVRARSGSGSRLDYAPVSPCAASHAQHAHVAGHAQRLPTPHRGRADGGGGGGVQR